MTSPGIIEMSPRYYFDLPRHYLDLSPGIRRLHRCCIRRTKIKTDHMEKNQLKRLPVGIQTFSNIIEDGMLYVDKTEYVWRMVHLSKYIFLSRPRRFGKSLLISTLQAYFEGRRELFKGLYIDSVEKEWTEYPVLRISMASG